MAMSRGSIPAWAGETAGHQRLHLSGAVYPRVGGGNARHPAEGLDVEGLSPRGRGKLTPSTPKLKYQRSIPAWAGETAAK